jgi:hypothetical protein
MFRPLHVSTPSRRGVILLVVLSMITLFSIVGLTFVLYADSAASSSRLHKEATNEFRPDLEPELALALFLEQLLFDAPDHYPGVSSALRGHSLARLTFGGNNGDPFSGVGRLHTGAGTYMNPFGQDDYKLVNYQYHRADGFLRDPERYGKYLVATGQYDTTQPWRIDPFDANVVPGYFTGGFNVPYTYPDLNNMFLAAVKADGTLLTPSYHRKWLFNPNHALNDPNNPNWTNPAGKYMILRPRPIDMGPGFPYPEDATGDVKNLPWAPGGNDSIWIDLGAPVMVAPNGKKYKPLFAPLIIDLDNRLNLIAHGNVRGLYNGQMITDPITNQLIRTHVSNQGWGPWEVNLGRVLTRMRSHPSYPGGPMADPVPEWTQLFFGTRRDPATFPTAVPYRLGKYGPNLIPGNGGAATAGTATHFYSQVDFDAAMRFMGGTDYVQTAGKVQIPPPTPASGLLSPFPAFPTGFDNGSGSNPPVAGEERFRHPLVYNIAPGSALASAGDDRKFQIANLEKLLRYGDTGTEGLTSELMELLPNNLSDPVIRRLVTLLSHDRPNLGMIPWLYNISTNPYGYPPAGPYNVPPAGNPIRFPPLTDRPASMMTNGEFLKDSWQAKPPARIELNRTFVSYPVTLDAPPYPKPGMLATPLPQQYVGYNDRFDITEPATSASAPLWQSVRNGFAQVSTAGVLTGGALGDRHQFADMIYRRLLDVTGVAPVAVPANPTPEELAPRRWLAQLAVNIVDYLDPDDRSTPFNFYTPTDLGSPGGLAAPPPPIHPNYPQIPRYWVFGTELPRVVLNEVLAEYRPPATMMAGDTGRVKVWVELHNTMQALPPGQPLQGQDGLPVPLYVQPIPATQDSVSTPGTRNGYAPYQVMVATRLGQPLVGTTDYHLNVTGEPSVGEVRCRTDANDFAAAAATVAGPNQLNQFLPSQAGAPPGSEYIRSPYIDVRGGQTGSPYLLLGPPQEGTPPRDDARDTIKAPRVPNATPILRTANLEYVVTNSAAGVPQPDDRPEGVTVLLRRLANPHLPPNPNPYVQVGTGGTAPWQPNPWYNPYITIDYLAFNRLNDTTQPATVVYGSRSKRQPYASKINLANPPPDLTPAATSPVVETAPPATDTSHSFGLQNTPPPQSGTYDWLVHLDRQLISPMELLHVSGYRPHELTQRFILEDVPAQKFQHYAPWFDQGRRLYRMLEHFQTYNRATGGNGPTIPGKVNVNTLWEDYLPVWRALGDAQLSNNFTPAQVDSAFQQLRTRRTPDPSGALGAGDRPFLSLAAPYTTGAAIMDTQFPNGLGIERTLLGSVPGTGGPTDDRLLQTGAATDHPYLRNELLTKVYNHLTVRSNVFAVWVTVGFFEVVDDTTVPVKLGAEIGRAENRHVRHRMFALVDRASLDRRPDFITRTGAAVTPGPQTVPIGLVTGTVSSQGMSWSWRIVPGTTLEISGPAATNPTERVIVSAVDTTVTPPRITAVFAQARAANAIIRVVDNAEIQTIFDPRGPNAPSVVLHFSIID